MRFSERMGITQQNIIQKEKIENSTLNRIWNIFDQHFLQIHRTKRVDKRQYFMSLSEDAYFDLASNYLSRTRDSIASSSEGIFYGEMKNIFFHARWFTIYDLLEWSYHWYESYEYKSGKDKWYNRTKYIKELNELFAKDLVAYRMIEGIIVEITSEDEIKEIELAINNNLPHSGITQHLTTALNLMAKKPIPDYRNSIKESISAVETLCSLILGSNQTLGRALNAIKERIHLDPHLEEGFKQIYKYTSNANGIRHALMSDPDLDVEDARFMLVSCSTFINYLFVKADKAGISLG